MSGRRTSRVGMLVLLAVPVCVVCLGLVLRYLPRWSRPPMMDMVVRPQPAPAPVRPTATSHQAPQEVLRTVNWMDAGEAKDVIAKMRLNVDAAGPDGVTALHIAASYDMAREVGALLSAGADVHRLAHCGTPLDLAASTGSVKAARVLLAHGADPNRPDEAGMTPLHWACLWGHARAAGLLIEAGARVNRAAGTGETPLLLAARNGDRDVVEVLLERGAGPSTGGKQVESPLCAAAVISPELAATLVKVGAPVDTWAAAALGDLPRLEALLADEAAVDAPDGSGRTPLHWAVRCGQEAAVRTLLARGADPAAADSLDWTPLHYAASSEQTPTAPCWVGCMGWDRPELRSVVPNLCGSSRWCDGVLEALLDKAQGLNPVNSIGATPLDLAGLARNEAAVRLLEAQGALRSPGLDCSRSMWHVRPDLPQQPALLLLLP